MANRFMQTVLPVIEEKYDRLAGWILCAQIFGATFLQKGAIIFGNGTQFYQAFFLMMGLTLLGIFTKRLELQKSQCVFFLIMAGSLALTQILGQSGPAFASIFFLIIMHVPYAFTFKKSLSKPGIELEFFQKCMLVIALFGIAQYFLQYVIGSNYAFFLDTLFYDRLIIHGFHGLNPLHYGSPVYKSNGFFMLEPAIFCQFLAIAVVIEVAYFKNLKRMAAYLAAIALTFSGTGLVILFGVVPFYLIQKRQFMILSILIFITVTAVWWAPYVGLGPLITRATEITNPHSSGYARFFSMFPFINDYILSEAGTFFFGRGAGSIPWDDGALQGVDYELFNPTWAKMFFEYGLIGSLFYFPFMAYLLIKSPKSTYLKWALTIQFILLGEYIFPPTVHGLIIALLIWPSIHNIKNEQRKMVWTC